MNKTVTCNIAGLVFHIEDQAYEKLLNYLNAVKKRLSNSEDADEIIQDIESRIAELFSISISNRQEVVLEKNVNDVIAALGAPEDFILDEEEEQQTNANRSADSNGHTEKTLMRDTENGVIAGVCSGVAAYIGWDVVFVRILFLLAFVITGFGFLVYIVLWIAAPKALSSTDRLRMQGKPINLDTISQEVQEAAERLERYAQSPRTRKGIEQIRSKGSQLGVEVKRFFGALMFIGGVLGIIFFLFVGLMENGFFIDFEGESTVSLYHLSSIVFNSSGQAGAGWFGLLALVLLPLLFLSIAGVFMIFDIRGKVLGRIFLVLLCVWISGAVTFGIVSAQIARDFTYRESQEKELYSVAAKDLKLEIQQETYAGSGLSISDDSNFEGIFFDKDKVTFSSIELEMLDSKDSLFHISSTYYASGFSRRKAYSRIENIRHQVVLDSNVVKISPSFQFPLSDKLRFQKVIISVSVPKNGAVDWQGSKKKMYEIRDYRAKEWED